MEIATLLEYKKVLEDISEMTQEMSSNPFNHTHRMYKWRGNYMLERLDTEDTICLRQSIHDTLLAAREKGIFPRQIIFDL